IYGNAPAKCAASASRTIATSRRRIRIAAPAWERSITTACSIPSRSPAGPCRSAARTSPPPVCRARPSRRASMTWPAAHASFCNSSSRRSRTTSDEERIESGAPRRDRLPPPVSSRRQDHLHGVLVRTRLEPHLGKLTLGEAGAVHLDALEHDARVLAELDGRFARLGASFFGRQVEGDALAVLSDGGDAAVQAVLLRDAAKDDLRRGFLVVFGCPDMRHVALGRPVAFGAD